MELSLNNITDCFDLTSTTIDPPVLIHSANESSVIFLSKANETLAIQDNTTKDIMLLNTTSNETFSFPSTT